MIDYRIILGDLRNVDFSSESRDYVYRRLRSLGLVGVVVTSLSKRKRIIRARLSNESSFTNISELSFKPDEYNNTFQRASTPHNTMFYGSIVPEILGNTEPETARITVLFELSEFARSAESIGEQNITFSAWEVQDEMELISLVHHKGFERPTELSRQLQEQFEQFTSEHPNLQEQTLEVSEYLANEFAKSEIPSHLHYMVSALYSEIICSNFDGVLYPSVRLAGEGINVAVKPEAVNNKFKFLGASECTVYKNGQNIFIGNNYQSTHDSEGNLTFSRIEGVNYVPRELGRLEAGLNPNNSHKI